MGFFGFKSKAEQVYEDMIASALGFSKAVHESIEAVFSSNISLSEKSDEFLAITKAVNERLSHYVDAEQDLLREHNINDSELVRILGEVQNLVEEASNRMHLELEKARVDTLSEHKDYLDRNYERCVEIRDFHTAGHLKTLLQKRKQLIAIDHYGVVDDRKWRAELRYFLENVIHPKIINDTELDLSFITLEATLSLLDDDYLKMFEELASHHKDELKTDYHDGIDPIGYEQFCLDALKDLGWDAQMTKASGDQGADVIAKRGGTTLVLQCKKFSSPVGNKAVQEVFSAKQFYYADLAAVVTNNTYTQSAKELANTNGVLLLHHDELQERFA